MRRRCLRLAVVAPPPPSPPPVKAIPTNYVSSAFHKELAGLSAKQQPALVFAALRRFEGSFQVKVEDLDAGLHALARCNRDSWTSAANCGGGGGLGGNEALGDAELQRLLGLLEQKLPSLGHETRYLATTSWALASLSQWQPQLSPKALQRMNAIFAQCEDLASSRLASFQPNNLSMLAWAFARAGVGTKDLFQRIGDESLKRLDQLQAREISNLTWSFAKTKLSHQLLASVREVAKSKGLNSFEEQDLSSFTWGLATLQIRDVELLAAAGQEVDAKVQLFTPQGLVCTTWAFASLRLEAVFLDKAVARLQEFQLEPKGCAMLLWSLATLRKDCE
ncbi:unnamed protein product, partial [Effrenium voratum]